MGPLILLAFMALFGYFMLIRPMRTQKRARAAMMAQLEPGAEVLTVGGVYGRVLDLRDDDLDLEVADGVVLRVTRRAVAAVSAAATADGSERAELPDPDHD